MAIRKTSNQYNSLPIGCEDCQSIWVPIQIEVSDAQCQWSIQPRHGHVVGCKLPWLRPLLKVDVHVMPLLGKYVRYLIIQKKPIPDSSFFLSPSNEYVVGCKLLWLETCWKLICMSCRYWWQKVTENSMQTNTCIKFVFLKCKIMHVYDFENLSENNTHFKLLVKCHYHTGWHRVQRLAHLLSLKCLLWVLECGFKSSSDL